MIPTDEKSPDLVQNYVPLKPAEILEIVSEAGVTKSNLAFIPLILRAILAGMFIAFGAVFSTIAITGMPGVWPYGIMKTIQGLTFCVGLILVVVGGAELFTGNMLLIIPLLEKKISLTNLLRNWGIVYLFNFLGSFFIAILIVAGKTYNFADGDLGRSMFTIAGNKIHIEFFQAIVLGLLCNILVCLAVWLAYAARNTTDKILAVIFPISAFIAAGFEHSVANMYLIPVALILKAIDPVFCASLSMDVTAINWTNFLYANLLPVTIGNILGGALFVGVSYYLSYRKTT